jgi:hypothetical protein
MAMSYTYNNTHLQFSVVGSLTLWRVTQAIQDQAFSAYAMALGSCKANTKGCTPDELAALAVARHLRSISPHTSVGIKLKLFYLRDI